MLTQVYRKLVQPFLTARFLKFCSVGASGVVVNLAVLYLLRSAGVRTNLASLGAIEISLLSNFFVNYAWTFRDRHPREASMLRQLVRFQLVSLLGAGIQFVTFAAMNMAFLVTMFDVSTRTAYHHAGLVRTWNERWLVHPFVDPPDVGPWVYVSQVVGVGAATVWNYLLNYYWTWSQRGETHHG